MKRRKLWTANKGDEFLVLKDFSTTVYDDWGSARRSKLFTKGEIVKYLMPFYNYDWGVRTNAVKGRAGKFKVIRGENAGKLVVCRFKSGVLVPFKPRPNGLLKRGFVFVDKNKRDVALLKIGKGSRNG